MIVIEGFFYTSLDTIEITFLDFGCSVELKAGYPRTVIGRGFFDFSQESVEILLFQILDVQWY